MANKTTNQPKTKTSTQKVITKVITKPTTEQKEAKKWVKYAKSKGVTLPFFSYFGTVIRTCDGKKYPSPETFIADGGSADWSNVQSTD